MHADAHMHAGPKGELKYDMKNISESERRRPGA